jgi:ribonuclease Z
MKIPLYFLGTGQAIPTARRNHTALLLKYKEENILIDCGEGTQRQFRKAKLNPCKITRMLITHNHGDHIFGIPGLLQTLTLNNYSKILRIYGPKGTKKFLGLMLKMFVRQGKIKLEIKEISFGRVFETPEFYVQAEPMRHGTPCLAYSFVEKDKIRIYKNKLKKLKLKGKIISKLSEGKDVLWKGKKIRASQLTYKQEGRKIAIVLDTAPNPNCYKIAKNSDLLVSEAVYSESESELAKQYKHLTAGQAAKIAGKSKAKKLILTHLSQRYENKENRILEEAEKIFKNTKVAEDLDVVEI